ncbi:MAG: filament integrity protein FraC [Microcoleaceae cyanobacterium]
MNILPLRLIWIQTLVLLISIAIEAWFLNKTSYYGKKLSAQYATIVNLLVTCLGWLAFFYFFTVNSSKFDSFKETIILLVLFGKNQSPSFILFLALISFSLAYFLKWQILQILETIRPPNSQGIPLNNWQSLQTLLKPKPTYEIFKRGIHQQIIANQAQAVFVAHLCTNVAIVIILIVLRRS